MMFFSKAVSVLSGIMVSVLTVHAKPSKYVLDKGKEGERKKKSPPQSIIGGNVIEPHSRPYLVSVGAGRSGYYGQYCGGSLISPHAVLTAASCVFRFGTTSFWTPPEWVEFNRHDLFNDTDVTRVYLNDRSQCDGDVVYHPEYDDYGFDYDVAILFLPTAIHDITPVTLNTDPNLPSSETPLDVTGWGFTENSFPEVPSAVTLDYVSNEACTKKPYRYKDDEITKSMMCAYAEGKGVCYGDVGGPLVLGNGGAEGDAQTPVVQVGIASWANRCADQRFPSVFSRMSEVADWVKGTVCSRTGELCNNSKSGKNSKAKKTSEKCVKVPTYAPWPTFSPTITAPPFTPWPTYSPTITAPPYTPWPTYSYTKWPTWMPTESPMAKSEKLLY